MCVFERVVERVCAIFYSPQAPVKRVWKPFSPKLIQQNSASHFVKGRSSLKTRLNQPWVLKLEQNEYNHFLVTC